MFSALFLGFIQVNRVNTGTINAHIDTESSGIFDLHKTISLTKGLTHLDSVYYTDFANFNTKDGLKSPIKNVNAIQINKQNLIIKGYNESSDDILLKTIDSNIQNTSIKPFISSENDQIVPVTIDIALDDAVELQDNDAEIIEYEVVSGDTLSSIAQKFNISVDTILWANDLNSKSTVKIGEKLVILPVTGVSYKVKKGDTISSLSARFDVSEKEIMYFNKTDGDKLIIGENIIIPGGKISNKNTNNKVNNSSKQNSTKNTSAGTSSKFARPILGGIKTQGIHGNNAVDIGAPVGTPIYAALDGVVSLIRGGDAWNGGYGNYIVVKHSNGVQTLYAHLSSIQVQKGQSVDRGELIGKSGNTGRSTGPHLHFEVRGAKNPF